MAPPVGVHGGSRLAKCLCPRPAPSLTARTEPLSSRLAGLLEGCSLAFSGVIHPSKAKDSATARGTAPQVFPPQEGSQRRDIQETPSHLPSPQTHQPRSASHLHPAACGQPDGPLPAGSPLASEAGLSEGGGRERPSALLSRSTGQEPSAWVLAPWPMCGPTAARSSWQNALPLRHLPLPLLCAAGSTSIRKHKRGKYRHTVAKLKDTLTHRIPGVSQN